MSFYSIAQKNLKKIQDAEFTPMRNSEVFEYSPVNYMVCYSPGLVCTSKNDSVFSICTGKVIAVFEVERNKFAILIRNNERYVVYSYLKNIAVNRLDSINKKTFLGKVENLNEENKSFEIILEITNNKGNVLPINSLIDLINDDKFQKAQECDATMMP